MGNILNVKEVYTGNEWSSREDYYVKEIGAIILPMDPNTKDVMKLTSQIDSLLTEAMLELAYIKRKYQDLDTKMKLAEKETFSILKAMPSTGTTAAKLTENDVKGLVVQYLKSHPLTGFKHDIYALVSSVEHRLVFIEMVVKMLTEKKGALISDNAMIKIEASMGNSTVNP